MASEKVNVRDYILKWKENEAFKKALKECTTARSTRSAGAKRVAVDRKSTRLNSSHSQQSRMPSSA